MIKSILSRFTKSDKPSNNADVSVVDISRVVPGYTSPNADRVSDAVEVSVAEPEQHETVSPSPQPEEVSTPELAPEMDAETETQIVADDNLSAPDEQDTLVLSEGDLVNEGGVFEIVDRDANQEERAEAAFAKLSDKYEEWLERDLTNLSAAWQAVQDDPANLEDLIRASHDLKGMATTYGYPAIGRITTSLGKLLESKADASSPALINLHVEACRAAHVEGQPSEDDNRDTIAQSVCAALETRVNQLIAS